MNSDFSIVCVYWWAEYFFKTFSTFGIATPETKVLSIRKCSFTYSNFNTRRRILPRRYFGIFTIIQTPLDILSQFSIQTVQILFQKTCIISKENAKTINQLFKLKKKKSLKIKIPKKLTE